MWRLWNKLFGWHYVSICSSEKTEILRVRIIKNKFCKNFYYILSGHQRLLLDKHCGAYSYKIAEAYIPLTFKPEELIK